MITWTALAKVSNEFCLLPYSIVQLAVGNRRRIDACYAKALSFDLQFPTASWAKTTLPLNPRIKMFGINNKTFKNDDKAWQNK